MTRALIMVALLVVAGCADNYSRESRGSGNYSSGSGGKRVAMINRCQAEAKAAGASARICPCVIDRYIASYGTTIKRPPNAWVSRVRQQCGG